MKRQVVFGFLGTQLDAAGKGSDRWTRWRPTLTLCRQEDLVVSRLELFYDPKYQAVLDRLVADLAAVSPETALTVRAMPFDDPWDFEQVYATLHAFARDYPFDLENEEYLIHITTGTHVAQICLFLLTEARYFPGLLVQTFPPRSRDPADPGGYVRIDLDLSRYDLIAQRFAAERAERLSLLKSGIATRNPAFNRMIEAIERVAERSRAPILLMGPTGAGKSFLARRIFELKQARRLVAGPFVEVNCATLRGDGAMSALFGHVKGAFTGAAAERAGLLRQAHGGLLFLDEIGELGTDEQAMLLKAVEEKRFFPMGSDREAASDFQLIAGTCRDLRREVAAGRFREDLYARINLWTFRLPGLAERREDIEPNLEYELARHARDQGRMIRFNKEARERYLAFAGSAAAPWAGNFRELSASLTRMATLAEGGRIRLEEVEEEIGRLAGQWQEPEAGDGLEEVLEAETLAGLDRFDRVQLAEVVRVCRGATSLSEAGRLLFAASREKKKSANDADRLRKYLARFGLEWGALGG